MIVYIGEDSICMTAKKKSKQGNHMNDITLTHDHDYLINIRV